MTRKSDSASGMFGRAAIRRPSGITATPRPSCGVRLRRLELRAPRYAVGTHGALLGTHAFQASPFDHSGTHP